jgi:hypothetical protein
MRVRAGEVLRFSAAVGVSTVETLFIRSETRRMPDIGAAQTQRMRVRAGEVTRSFGSVVVSTVETLSIRSRTNSPRRRTWMDAAHVRMMRRQAR